MRARLAFLPLATVVLGLAFVLGAPQATSQDGAPKVVVDLLPDTWPTLPRVLGYTYNLNNHRDAPAFDGVEDKKPSMDQGNALSTSKQRKRYRVLGVVVRNMDAQPLDCKVVVKSHVAGEPRRLKLGAYGESGVAYFPIVEKDVPLKVEVRNSRDQVVATLDGEQLPSSPNSTTNRFDAYFVAQELQNEQRVHDQYVTYPVSALVLDNHERPVPRATLTFLHDKLGLVQSFQTDEGGRWQGRLIGGAWTAISFGVTTEIITPTVDQGQTVAKEVKEAKGTLYLIKSFTASGQGTQIELRADQLAKVRVKDEGGVPLELLRLTVAPHAVGEALRYADVASRCAASFILDVPLSEKNGAFDLMTNKGAFYDLVAFGRLQQGTTALISLENQKGDGEVPVVFSPGKMARIVFDPPTGAGGGKTIDATLTLLGAQRQQFQIQAKELETVFFPAGPGVRLDMSYAARNGDRLSFLPRRVEGKAGSLYDATPRAPFAFAAFFQKERGGVQAWVAITDGAGQVVGNIQSEGSIAAFNGGEKLFEHSLAESRFAFPGGLAGVDLQNLALEAKFRIGSEHLQARPPFEPVTKYAAHGTNASSPRIVNDHAEAFLGMVQKSCEGEKKFFGAPPAPPTVGMDFQVFLPPGVGGLGGGGMIALDLGELLNFVDESDPLPYAFCHELGHNCGFGHDPYMLMAPCGVEEGTYGALGYRMVHGNELSALFTYLGGRRYKDKGTWTLSPGVFAGIRLIYGPDVHKKLFDMAKAHEKALENAGLSRIERIATMYSLAVGENVAWIFRAYGWPIFDFRVDWGQNVVMTDGRDVSVVKPDAMDFNYFKRWWVQGPLTEAASAKKITKDTDPTTIGTDDDHEAGAASELPWQIVNWPTDFIWLDTDLSPAPAKGPDLRSMSPDGNTHRYRLFNRITVPQMTIGYLIGTSDVGMDVRLNGHVIMRLESNPPFNQPRHDGLMLNQKKVSPVMLLAGENTIEVDAVQVAGTRGFCLGLTGEDGHQIAVKMNKSSPDGEVKPETKPLRDVGPVMNGGFEDGLAAWIDGPIEGSLTSGIETAGAATGKKCLRLTAAGSATGGLIQRVVVEPGASYRLHAKMRADKLEGEAYVEMFSGDIKDGRITRTEPAELGAKWVDLTGSYTPKGKTRSVYIACYVNSRGGGTVWFDDVELIREK